MNTHEKANDNPKNYVRDSYDRFLGFWLQEKQKCLNLR